MIQESLWDQARGCPRSQHKVAKRTEGRKVRPSGTDETPRRQLPERKDQQVQLHVSRAGASALQFRRQSGRTDIVVLLEQTKQVCQCTLRSVTGKGDT